MQYLDDTYLLSRGGLDRVKSGVLEPVTVVQVVRVEQ
jgi:hypothetical protein